MGRGWPLLILLMLLFVGCAPADKTAAKPQAKQPADIPVDAFNLPLVITIEAPEVPPEIAKPSPPIKDESPSH